MASMKRREEAEARSIAEQAAEWLLILEQRRMEDEEAFSEWLKRSPLHVGAFLRASAVDQLGAEIDRSREIPIDEGPFPDVLEIRGAPVAAQPQRRHSALGGKIIGLAASLVAAAVSATWCFHHFSSDGLKKFTAAVGEQRVIELEDGSTMFLEPGSSVEMRFYPKERWLRVVNGGAMFKVAHNRTRPFRVHSGNATIQAVGTQFSVSRLRDDSIVSVVEGVVQVTREAGFIEKLLPNPDIETRAAVRLAAGEETRVASDGAISAPRLATADPVRTWKERRLTFLNETLFAIADEFNRYNRTPQIRVADAAAGELRFAAAFDASDMASLVLVLDGSPKLQVERTEVEIIIRSR
jgi:transmembrane sensor